MLDIDAIYKEYAPIVFKFLISLCNDADTAEELTQETFYRAIKSANRYDGTCKVSTWLCQIAKHLWYQEIDKRKRKGTALLDENIVSDKLDLEEWQTKWGVTRIDMKVNQQLQKQYEWCLMNDFNYTPIKIINNKLYPSEYSISDLKFFLKDFSNEQQPVENQVLLQA